MIRNNKNKLNNQGFSLIELLVAMALAGVITVLLGTLMSNGSVWFSGETAKADVQNDIQTINAKVQKTLMEATAISVSKDTNGVTYILTGEWDESAGDWKAESNPNGTARAIIVYKNRLYIADTKIASADLITAINSEKTIGNTYKGYEVSSNLAANTFQAELNYTTDKDNKLNSQVTVAISYEMLKNKKKSKSSYEVKLRNSSSLALLENNGTVVTLK